MRDSNNLRISIRLVAHQDLAHPIGLGNGIAIERTAPTGDRVPLSRYSTMRSPITESDVASFEPRTVTERIIGVTVSKRHYERVPKGARKEHDDGGTGRRPVPPRVSQLDSFGLAQLE